MLNQIDYEKYIFKMAFLILLPHNSVEIDSFLIVFKAFLIVILIYSIHLPVNCILFLISPLFTY